MNTTDKSLNAPARKLFYIAVNGCQENHMDGALVDRYLSEKCDMSPAANLASADVILVQGCSVTQHMENESRDMVAHLQKLKRPEAKVIVVGCLSKFRPDSRTGDTDPAVPLAAIDSLAYNMDQNARQLAVNVLYQKPPEILQFLAHRKEQVFQDYSERTRRRTLRRASSAVFKVLFRGVQRYKDFVESRLDPCNPRVYSIKIETGCLGQCSYCSVRLARGTVRSKTIEEVLEEIQRGLDQGYRHFAFIGTDIADYGKDINLDLIDLLRRVVALPADFRLRLRNLNPRCVIDRTRDFCEVLRSGKISFAQIAIQSGNDRILDLMKRGYHAGDFMRATAEIRRACPSIVLRTQIIAGFPTETEKEFLDSVSVMDSKLFDYADFFRYTKRSGTEAAEIGPEVPFDAIMRRYRKLFVKALFKNPLRKLSAVKRMKTYELQ